MKEKNIEKDKFNKLADLLKRGDKKAGKEIFNYFSPLIYRFFMARILNRACAEDLVQGVFLKVVARIDTFDEGLGNFSGWIWQVARNSLIDYYRDKKEVAFADMPEGFENLHKAKDITHVKMAAKEIFEVVKNFREDEQEVFALHYLSDLSYKEMSKIAGKSEGALRVAVHRLNKKIRSTIHD